MKFKKIFFILAVSSVIFSCSKDNNNSVPFDAAKQALDDDTTLIDYLKTHYLKENGGGLDTITNGESSLMNDVRLGVQNVLHNDINYKLYYLQENEGATVSPSSVDSIYYNYTGMLLDSTVFDTSSNFSWNTLFSPSTGRGFISGWQYGFTNFKGGNVVMNADESFDFVDYGKGILFIPSGLAYGNIAESAIPVNSPLIFEISLKDVHLTDHDLDGVLSKFEDLDNDNILSNDDTDGDGIPNYYDTDDDGDGKLTKDEDTNGNGNWFDDDTDGDGTPNFLDEDN